MSTDPMDQPPDDSMSLVLPFVATFSNGGPYEDDAFVAGFQAGEIDRSLKAAAAVGATRAQFTAYTELVKQLELIGMNRGFPTVEVETWPAAPEWCRVTFVAAGGDR